MQLNIKEFLQEAEVCDALYPGKRLVKSCRQSGDYKSHCVVIDWRDPDKIRIEVKAGLSGKDLEPSKLKYYPVSFQAPTFVDIEIVNDNEEEDEETEGKTSSGKGGSGGKKPKASMNSMMNAFGDAIEGKVPDLGKIVDMVVAGTEIAKEAYAQVMDKFAQQLANGKIMATDLLAKAGDYVTKYTPPAFMKPTGDEQANYKYDREKNADIGFSRTMG